MYQSLDRLLLIVLELCLQFQILSHILGIPPILQVLELLFCTAVGYQPGIPARRWYKLRRKGLRPGKEADGCVHHRRYGSVPGILYPR